MPSVKRDGGWWTVTAPVSTGPHSTLCRLPAPLQRPHLSIPHSHASPTLSLSLVSPSPRNRRRRHLRRSIPACSGGLAGAQHRSELPCLRSSLPSGQIRLSRPRELITDPFPWLGFRGWRPHQLQRGSGDCALPSSTPTASPTGGSASWMVLLHPMAAGQTRAVGKLQRRGTHFLCSSLRGWGGGGG